LPITAERRAIINRRNARRSTGPRTARGKSVFRFNGRTHGLTSRYFALVPEDSAAYRDHLLATIRSQRPQSVSDLRITVFLAAAGWLIHRANRMEISFVSTIGADFQNYLAERFSPQGRAMPQAMPSAVRRRVPNPVLRMPELESLSRHRARLERHYLRMMEVRRLLRDTKNEPKKRSEKAALRYYRELPEFVRKIMQTQMVVLARHVDSLRLKTKNENRSQSFSATRVPERPIAPSRTAAAAPRLLEKTCKPSLQAMFGFGLPRGGGGGGGPTRRPRSKP